MKTYQEPVTEIVELEVVDTAPIATTASGAFNDPSVFG